MERYDDEAVCRCGAWVAVTVLRHSSVVQLSSATVICSECVQTQVEVAYNWAKRRIAYVRYQPLSVDTKPKLQLVR